MSNVRSSTEFWFGLFCVALAGVSLFAARNLNLGTLSAPGAGFFLRIITLTILAFGALFILRGILVRGEPGERWHWRPLLVITLALIVFALIVRSAGLAVATFVLTGIAAFASDESRVVDVVITAFALVAFGALLFVYALGIPLPILPVGF